MIEEVKDQWHWPQRRQEIQDDVVHHCIDTVDDKFTEMGYPIARAVIRDFFDQIQGQIDFVKLPVITDREVSYKVCVEVIEPNGSGGSDAKTVVFGEGFLPYIIAKNQQEAEQQAYKKLETICAPGSRHLIRECYPDDDTC